MQAAAAGLASLLKRDRTVVASALVVMTLIAWAYVLWLSAHMSMPGPPAPDSMAGMDMGSNASSGGDMAGMDMSGMGGAITPSFRVWGPADFVFMFAMWSVMMVGMMTPSVAPMVLLYAGVGRKAAESGTPFASTGWFFAGYLAVWIAFSALATFAQWVLTALALLTPMMAVTSTTIGGVVLIGVALYQWTPLKDTCLRSCQAPIAFLMAHGGFRSEPLGAIRLGIVHGAYCLGCCFALMTLLFVGGIMNVLWIAGLTILALLEKIVPAGRFISRISGVMIGSAGVWLLAHAV
jgi:predicted metal-binding membrane protein